MEELIAGRLRSWASQLDGQTAAQAARTATVPVLDGAVALMPDAHLGIGATVGSVIPTAGAIIPAAVGVDLGCGMVAVETGLDAAKLPDDLGGLLRALEGRIPAGVGQGHDVVAERAWERFVAEHGLPLGAEGTAVDAVVAKAPKQFGTLGSGNHFVEVCTDERGVVWLQLHSGSRGPGNVLAQGHINAARGLLKTRLESVEDPDLAWLAEGEPQFARYIHDLRWAQAYAYANRERMMDVAERLLAVAVGRPLRVAQRVNCHHNYAVREVHGGRERWITRKGAISARAGQLGLIPGSMATGSYVVRGLGSEASWQSASHGAGRRLSRTAARKAYTAADLAETMAGRTWLSDRAGKLVDEISHAYKDLDVVMRDQADLVEVVHRLETVLNYKGT